MGSSAEIEAEEVILRIIKNLANNLESLDYEKVATLPNSEGNDSAPLRQTMDQNLTQYIKWGFLPICYKYVINFYLSNGGGSKKDMRKGLNNLRGLVEVFHTHHGIIKSRCLNQTNQELLEIIDWGKILHYLDHKFNTHILDELIKIDD